MDAQLQQLESEGYTIFPQFLDKDTTMRIREHIDSLLPPVAPKDEAGAQRLYTLRHPIPGEIMAEILVNPSLLELAEKILYSDDLRVLEQVLIRTDPQNAEAGASRWHIDMPFLPEHYEARPRQTYFHMVHALNTVPPNGGATTIIPGSHHKTYAKARELGSIEALQPLKENPIEVAGLDLDGAIEVLPQEGDLLVFNPMCLHSASTNISDQSRYVYFASFMDESAEYIRQSLRDIDYQRAFPDSMREAMPENLKYLLEA